MCWCSWTVWPVNEYLYHWTSYFKLLSFLWWSAAWYVSQFESLCIGFGSHTCGFCSSLMIMSCFCNGGEASNALWIQMVFLNLEFSIVNVWSITWSALNGPILHERRQLFEFLAMISAVDIGRVVCRRRNTVRGKTFLTPGVLSNYGHSCTFFVQLLFFQCELAHIIHQEVLELCSQTMWRYHQGHIHRQCCTMVRSCWSRRMSE